MTRAVGDHVPEGRYATYGHRGGRADPGRPPGDLPGAGSLGRRSGPQPRAPERQDRYRGSGPGGPAADERLSGTQPVQALGPEAVAAGFGPSASAGGSPAAAPARPYGRILIFTLLDDRVADFDRLAEEAAEHVRTGEPDTLVYVIHLVPNAPMQRIFYEIYRDRAAFDSHESQPSMQRFVAERRSCVLATNVIELRLKYAKVAPLPNPQAPAAAAPAAPLPPPPGARGPQGPSGPQRLQPLPAGRQQRSDQQRSDQQRSDQQRYDQQRYDQQRYDQQRSTRGGPTCGRCRRRAGVTAVSVPRITLLGRPGCHLCDDARAVIERVAADLGVGWEERDITASPDDLREYWDKIPVTLVDGVQIDFWRVSEARLRAALG